MEILSSPSCHFSWKMTRRSQWAPLWLGTNVLQNIIVLCSAESHTVMLFEFFSMAVPMDYFLLPRLNRWTVRRCRSASPSVDSDGQVFCLTIASLFDVLIWLNRDVWRFFTLSCAVLCSQTARPNEAAAMFREARLRSANSSLSPN